MRGLTAEVTIFDGKASLARWVNGKVVTSGEFKGKACFLVYAQVPRWVDVPLPDGLTTLAELEDYVFQAARKAGVPTDRPFPFVLKGAAEKVTLHLLNKTDNRPHNVEEHAKVKVPVALEHADIGVVGFFSKKHAGVFTHHDSSTHMHVRTTDGKASGHLDHLVPGRGMRLFLPAQDR
ncbi:MAG: hypothetical protein K2X87_25215 [Gemmataceae bacterium]|nr:hypothetical protein [Gemmataceae bacterium]